MEKGCVKTYNWVVSLLNNCDFSDSAKRLGLEQISENAVLINFFDRIYKVSKNNIELIDKKTIWTTASEDYEYDLKSVLGYYILSDANIEPLYEYCALGQFSGGVFRESSSVVSMANKKFADTFGNDYDKFKKIMNMFGIEYEEGNRDGKYSWNYKILPKIPIKLVFYEGDDEFPSKLQILYDKNAIKIYNFEQLAVLHGIITQTILSLGKS
ncbi:hypothetical protein TREPR_1045 [Treponema primitia ZAS-2]|uniref:DUF3786 domain-containing protein n=1 Tax=Treponema primitia (strain ATCC BAA-887 / DSM 12427 / ZAS-2) TaxID=545694 RepID=F5YHN2_TREPZ|nr:DUF3786 domain-containing protein [Treponema primitia]AEF84093.1 hypothetical protein TREPR_1045 [Treponema primitia ZAS-2]